MDTIFGFDLLSAVCAYRYSCLVQTLAGLESTRGEESSDMPVFPSAPATNSRASSRSTTARHSEEETSNRPPATVGRAGRYQTGCEVADAGASAQRSKRPRNTESQDEAEYPSKRIRLPGPSTRTLRAVNFRFITLPCSHSITTGQFTLIRYR